MHALIHAHVQIHTYGSDRRDFKNFMSTYIYICISMVVYIRGMIVCGGCVAGLGCADRMRLSKQFI